VSDPFAVVVPDTLAVMRCLTLCGYGARHFSGGAVSDPFAVVVPDTFAVIQCLTPLR
jgi:hypothetical protein